MKAEKLRQVLGLFSTERVLIEKAYKELSELETKAAKWGMIQWAIDNQIGFVALIRGSGIWIENVDIDCLEQLYKECEQING